MKQTLEETIKEAIRKHYNCNGTYPCSERECGADEFKEGFIAGANWQAKQSPWISVKERLPNNDENIFYTNHLGGALGVGFYVDEKWHQAYTGDYIYGITHWMPIPKFN